MGPYLQLVEMSDGGAEGSSPVIELGGVLVLAVEAQPTTPITGENLDCVGSAGWV